MIWHNGLPTADWENWACSPARSTRLAEALQRSFSDLLSEVDMRKRRKREQEESQLRVRLNENRPQLATRAAGLGIWDMERNELVWDDAMYQQCDIDKAAFDGAYEAWSCCLARNGFERASGRVWVESAPGRGVTFFMGLRHG